MGLKLGLTDITKAYLGSTSVSAIYLGSTQVWGGGAAVPKGFVTKGDSITEGPTTDPYPTQLAAITGLGITNKGFSGQKLTAMDANYATEVGPFYNATNRDTLIVLGGINDITIDLATATALQPVIQSICGKGRTTGFRTWVCTLPPVKLGNIVFTTYTSAMETERAAYNTWLRANWNTFADGLIDLDGLASIQNTASTYNYRDGLHPTSKVNYLIAAEVARATGAPILTDAAPDAFTFTDVTNATLGFAYVSNEIELTGFIGSLPVSITGGTYSLNGAAYTSAPGTVFPHDKIKVQVTSSASNATAVSATLTIGSASDTYSVTTVATATSALATFGTFGGPGSRANGNRDLLITPQVAFTTGRSAFGKSSGKWYGEVFSAAAYTGSNQGFGFAKSDFATFNTFLGAAATSFSHWLASNTTFVSGVTKVGNPSATIAQGDTWMLAIDLDAGKAWIGKNGAWLASGDPATGANPWVTFTAGGTWYLGASVGGHQNAEAVRLPAAHTYTPPTGFTAWDDA